MHNVTKESLLVLNEKPREKLPKLINSPSLEQSEDRREEDGKRLQGEEDKNAYEIGRFFGATMKRSLR